MLEEVEEAARLLHPHARDEPGHRGRRHVGACDPGAIGSQPSGVNGVGGDEDGADHRRATRGQGGEPRSIWAFARVIRLS
jgi:hypothetical protein